MADYGSLYSAVEEKYYLIVERIGPIRGIIERIDSFFPSFLLLVLVVLGIAAFFVVPMLLQPTSAELRLRLVDAKGNPIGNGIVQLSFSSSDGGGETEILRANDSSIVSKQVPKDSNVSFAASARGYSTLKGNIIVGKENVSLDIVLKGKSETPERKIIFTLESGERIKGKIIQAKISCANTAMKPEEENLSSNRDGEMEFSEPENCGSLALTISGPAEFRQKSVAITESLTVIAMEFEEFEKGTIDLRIVDETGNFLENLSASVSLVKDGSVMQSFQIWHGHGTTEALPGHYGLLVQDNAAQFAMLEQVELDLNANTRISIAAKMSGKIAGFVSGKVIDSGIGEAIPNSSVELRGLEGNLIASAKSDENGEFRLPVINALFLFLNVFSEGYLPYSEPVELGGGEKTIALEKATESNSGKIIVSVFDPDNLTAANAVVTLHYADTLAVAPYGQKITDENGNAEFSGVKNGEYFAAAEKYPYSAQSIGQETKNGEEALFFVWFSATETGIALKAMDEKGNTIAGAMADAYNAADGSKLDSIELENGTGYYSARSDKRIYFVFSADGYLPYYTETFNLATIDFIKVQARVLKQVSGDSPRAQFNGVFNEFGERVIDLEEGKKYSARFEVLATEQRQFDSIGLHFRTGSTRNTGEDELQIVSARTGVAAILSGKTYNEPKGEETDFLHENSNAFPAKWVNAVVEEPVAGVYSVSFGLNVSADAKLNSLLPMFYRTWGNNNGAYYRGPEDKDLGQADSIPEKQELYAQTTAILQYFKRAERACYGTICFVANVQDSASGEFLEEPFELFKGSDYNVFFTIINSWNRDLESVSVSAENSLGGKQKNDLKITGFEIESQEQGFSDYSTAIVQRGLLGTEKSISGILSVSPQKGSYTALQFRINTGDGNDSVFNVFFDSFEKRLMAIRALPEKPVALAENKIMFFAADKETGKGIPKVLFKVSLYGADNSESHLEKYSDSNGTAEFFIPAMKPGSRMVVESFSAKFYSRPMELEFGSSPLYFSPARATVYIDTSESYEKKQSFKAVNALSQSVMVGSVELFLEEPAFFEEAEMKQFLGVFPREFEAFSENQTGLLLVKIRDSVFVPKNSRLRGAILLEAKSSGIGWAFSLPFEVIVNSADFSGASSCIGLKESEWEAELQKNVFYKEIELKNNCGIGAELINVYDLKPKAEWATEEMGNIEAVLLDSDGREITIVPVLKENSPLLVPELKAGAKAKIILRFVPKTGYWGKTANFGIKFSATSPGKEKETAIASDREISGNILLFNPLSCIKFSPHPSKKLEIGENDRNNSFEVDATQCGDNRIEFSLCENNNDCSSGTEGGILVSPAYFSTTKASQKKTIKVTRREIPGEYGINVTARVKGIVFRNFAEMLVEIQPEKTEQLALDKYSFYLNGNNSMDSATMTNKKLSEIVKVEASICDWREMLRQESRHFNFGDAGGGLRAAELSGASELFRKTMATSNSMAQIDSNSILVSLDAVRLAYEESMQADNDARIADASAKRALESAQYLKQETGKLKNQINNNEMNNHSKITSSCQGGGSNATGPLTQAQASSSTLDGAATDAQTATQDMSATMAKGSSSMGNSLAKAESMKNSAEEGKNNMMPLDSTEISIAHKIAANDFNWAREYGKAAAAKNKESENYIGIADKNIVNNINPILKQAITALAATEIAQENYLSIIPSATPPCCSSEHCSCGSCVNSVESQTQYMNGTVRQQMAQVSGAIMLTMNDLEKARADGEKAIESEQEARQALLDAIIKLRRAVSVARSLSEASFKTAEAQDSDSNVVNKMVSLYPFIGFVGSEFDSGIYKELEKPCDYKIKGALIDYITDLRNDVLPLQLDIEDVSAFLNNEEAKTFGDYNRQTIGIVFQNNGFDKNKPAYATLTIKYKKHGHDYLQDVPLGYNEFGPFRVPDSEVETLEQKFHVRMLAKPQEQAFIPEQQTENCVQGIKAGLAGKSALPRIKLDWGWDNERGISQNECEPKNQDYSYCDAAQFNIMLSKKMNFLDEWLSENTGRLKCPRNAVENDAREVIGKLTNRNSEAGSIGIESIAANVRGNSAAIIVSVKNDSEEEKTANIVFSLVEPKDVSLEGERKICIKTMAVPAKKTAGIDCVFSELPDSTNFYSAKSYMQPNDSYTELSDSVQFTDEQKIDLNSSLSVAFKTNEDTASAQCWLPNNTGLFDGVSALEYFARDSTAKWTENVKNMQGLSGLLRFDSYLIEDNYNNSFSSDFAEYYSKTWFFDTPSFFNDTRIGRTLNKYYSNERIVFNNKYFDSTKIPGAGLFSVDINSDFGESWQMFDAEKEPRATIKPVFSKIAEPFPSSPFYYMPFDSGIGTKSQKMERQDYGSAYIVSGQTIGLNETGFDMMPESRNSGAMKKVSAVFDQNLETINSGLLSRGTMLSVSLKGDSAVDAKIVFSPNYASPTIMRISAEKTAPASLAVYQLLKGEQAIDDGNSLSYWSGMDGCYDFFGIPAKKSFDYSPDRKATAKDNPVEWKKRYVFDSGAVEKAGSVLLKSIIYTPLSGTYSLKTTAKNVKFSGTAKIFSETKELNGIKGMQYNNKESDNYTRTIKDSLAAVQAGSACISNSGLETIIWWNTVAIERQAEEGKSIETMEKSLSPGSDCIAK